jgi:L-methionine (R)-S-oxide reductase
VDLFPGHIACDSESKSEIVVPIQTPASENGSERRLVGIIDIDCAVVEGFNEVDRRFLEQLAEFIGKACDW